MPKREAEYDYFDNVDRHGNVIKTLDRKLYAPDGSVFRMPFGGTPVRYVAKGYKLKPDAEWRKLNAEYEEAKAESLKRSDFQRESKNRIAEIKAREEQLALEKQMRELDAEIAAKEAALETAEDEVETFYPTPKPAKRKPGRPKKVEA